MNDEVKKTLINAGIAGIIAFITTFVTYLANTREAAVQLSQLEVASVGPLQKGQKLCRVFQGKTWRDGLIVPQNWTQSLCIDYMKKTGGNRYQLGCMYSDGTTLGKEDGSLPSPNCGWQ